MDFLLLFSGLIAQWMLGVALATLILGKRIWTSSSGTRTWRLIDRAELIGLGFVLGIAGTSYGQFLWALAGGSLGRTCSFCFGVIGLIGGMAAWLWCRNRKVGLRVGGESESAWVEFACVVLLLLFVSLSIQTVLTPQRLWDERAIFGLKSLVLFQEGVIDSPDLLHPDFVQYHPRYPLLIPLAEQHVYALLGRGDDRWAKLVFPQLYLGLALTFAGVLSRQLRPGAAWLWAIVLATVPILAFDDYGFLSGQADAPVACFHGVSVLYLWDWLRSVRLQQEIYWRSLVLGSIAAAMTVFTKDEGIAFLLVDAGLLLLLGVIAQRGSSSTWIVAIRFGFAAAALFFAVAICLLAPWWLHRGRLPGTTEMDYSGRLNWPTLREGLGTLRWSLPHMADRLFFQVPAMGLAWWGMVMAGLGHLRRAARVEQLFVLGDVIGAIAALLVAGMIAPTPVEEHLGGSSHRFLMQLAPVAVLYLAGQFHGGEDRTLEVANRHR